jgi:hypothetical protein
LKPIRDGDQKTWVPTDQVRGLKAHGTSPATGYVFEE